MGLYVDGTNGLALFWGGVGEINQGNTTGWDTTDFHDVVCIYRSAADSGLNPEFYAWLDGTRIIADTTTFAGQTETDTTGGPWSFGHYNTGNVSLLFEAAACDQGLFQGVQEDITATTLPGRAPYR